ncbi:transposase (plasmid) [Phaeobacter piscinae]|uniref:Transposase n=1 Tax=Phaeobacter piscinae TaxID=1580596 RepID=A0ABM6PJ29_9RHOB|nr:transposase [Phaeobacter piscinae]AUQ88326.1 transposase [Phaeobacter piscinae]AUR26209.1 transposase [Phaeobacter piscinae]
MSWDAVPIGRRGRQQTFRDAAIQTCLTMRVLFGMVFRQMIGFFESLLRLVGLDWKVPGFRTLRSPSEGPGCNPQNFGGIFTSDSGTAQLARALIASGHWSEALGLDHWSLRI